MQTTKSGYFNNPSLIKPILYGALIALVLITVFLSKSGDANPSWGKFWMLRPLIIVPLAGAVGGFCYYFLNKQTAKNGFVKVLIVLLSLLIYIIGLWMGMVLGLDGTYWN